MTAEEIQQILGLLINAGLAMSTLAIFFLARSWIHRNNRTVAIEVKIVEQPQQLGIKISNNSPEPIAVTGLLWNVGVISKHSLIWRKPFLKRRNISPGGNMELVAQDDELQSLCQFLYSGAGAWPPFLAQRSIRIALQLEEGQITCYKLLSSGTAKFLLKVAKAKYH